MKARPWILAAGVWLVLGLSATATAGARALPGPSSISSGLVDYSAFQQTGASAQAVWFGRARAIDASWIRLTVYWSSIAPLTRPAGFRASDPASPGYGWSSLDTAVRAATAAGRQVVLTVLQAPVWAEGPGVPSYASPGSWEPSPSAYAAFAHAIATRYSGLYPDPRHRGLKLPMVSHFQAWNETNLPIYLEPQWVQNSNGSIVPESAVIYRSLLNSFYAGVKAVQPRAFVLAAGTAPYGDPPGVNRMAPLTFLRAMFCLTPQLRALPCPNPPHFDALDHHPYSANPYALAALPDNVTLPILGRILRVLHAAQRVHHVLPGGSKSLWVTEFDYASNPPSPGALSLAVQAQYVSQAFYELWSQGVSHGFWYQLRDPLVFKKSFTGAGLYFGNGVAKPAAAAFRFPFVADPVPGHRKYFVTVWGRAPVAGTVAIQKRSGRRWRRLRSLPTTRGGIFYARFRQGSRGDFRAVIQGLASQTWVNP